MCRSIAALGYGLFVRTASLLAAADAHTKVEPTRRFVELVKLRRERGTLQAEGGGVERLPSEVWGMVLQEVIDVEVDEAMRCLMKKHLFPSCEGVIDGPTNFKAFELEYSDPTWVEAVENAAVRSCATCLTEGFDGWRMLLEEPGVQVIRNLLHFFSLGLPTTLTSPAMHPTNQFYLCSSFVALSMQNSCSSITAGAGGHMHPDEDCVFEVSFDVPQDANARLGRFLKQYRVEVVAVKEEQSGLRELDKGGTSGHKQDGKKGLGGGGGRAGWRFFCANERLW